MYILENYSYRNLYIGKKERNLLVESQVPADFPFLIDLLENNEKITHDIIKNLPQEQQIFFEDILPQVKQQAQAEWVPTGPCYDSGETSIPCSICGTPNRYIYYIKNTQNNRTMNVGSDCILNFFDNIKDRLAKGKDFKTIHKQNVTRARKIHRNYIFNQRFPGIDKKLEEWKDNYNNLPIVPNEKIEKEFNKCILDARELIKKFQNMAQPDEVLDEIIFEDFQHKVIDKYKIIEDSIEKYVLDMQDNPMAITKEIADWLKTNWKNDIIKLLKRQGQITHNLFAEIWEPNFISSMTPGFRKLLKQVGITINNIDNNRNSCTIKYKNFLLNITLRNLMLMLGPHIFGTAKKSLTRHNILTVCDLYGDNAMQVFINELNYQLSNYNLNIVHHDVEYGEAYIVNTDSEEVRKLSIVNLHMLFNKFLLPLLTEQIDAEMVCPLLSNYRIVTEKELERIIERRGRNDM